MYLTKRPDDQSAMIGSGGRLTNTVTFEAGRFPSSGIDVQIRVLGYSCRSTHDGLLPCFPYYSRVIGRIQLITVIMFEPTMVVAAYRSQIFQSEQTEAMAWEKR